MLLTFAELQFLLSLAPDEPSIDLAALLEEPGRDPELAAEFGMASLVARGLCAEELDGDDRIVSLDPELLDVLGAVHAAGVSLRITTVTPERTTFWLLLAGLQRIALTPAATGVYHVVPVAADADLREQAVSLVCSALADEPRAGVAISRNGRLDATSFRTNLELGGVSAGDAERRRGVESLVDAVFVDQHPSRG